MCVFVLGGGEKRLVSYTGQVCIDRMRDGETARGGTFRTSERPGTGDNVN